MSLPELRTKLFIVFNQPLLGAMRGEQFQPLSPLSVPGRKLKRQRVVEKLREERNTVRKKRAHLHLKRKVRG